MNQNDIVQSLRVEIAKLQRVLDLLQDQSSGTVEVRRRGRPKGSGNKTASQELQEVAPKKRTMTAEGKARIAAAQKKRWAPRESAGLNRSSIAKKQSTKTATPKAAKKSAAARVKIGSTNVKAQGRSTKQAAPAKKIARKQVAAKKLTRPASKKSAKQAMTVATAPESTA